MTLQAPFPIRRLLILAPLGLVLVLMGLMGCSTTSTQGMALADQYYNLGNEWFDLKKYDKAAKAYQTALSWNENLKIATVNLARTKAELGDISGALSLLDPVAAAEPENLIVAEYQAWLKAKKDGIAAAADLYLALAKRLPGDLASHYNAGLSLKAAERDPEAIEVLRAWKTLGGKTPEGLSVLAELLEGASAPDTADAWLDVSEAFPENDPLRFAPLHRRAKVLEKNRLFGDAVQTWTLALGLPSAPEQPRSEALFRQGCLLLLELEDYESGSKAVIEAWKAGYKDSKAWKTLLEDPALRFGPRLEADLKLAEVTP